MTDATYTKGRWSLTDLIPASSGPEMEAVFDDLNAVVAELETHRDDLSPEIAADTFAEMVGLVERIAYRASQLLGYSTLWLAESTSDQQALAFRSRVGQALAQAQNRTLFFDLWWKALDPAAAERLAAGSGDVRYYLEALRRFAPYTLTEGEERVMNTKDVNGISGIKTLYEMITYALTFDMEIDGEVKPLTRTELMVHARSADPDRRKAAYEAMFDTFTQHKDVLGQMYQFVVGDWVQENVTLRKMDSPMVGRNLANDMPNEVVDALIEACRENVSLYRRFFRLKAKWIGMPKLRRVDIYAPLRAAEIKYSFDDGVRFILDTMTAFSPAMAQLAERVLSENHLDSEPRVGKDTGAFNYGVVPDRTPWVLVNYNGRADDVSTLGHELGHAVHSMMASDHSILTCHSSLPLAETASNFVEILLLSRWLDEVTDDEARTALMAKYVDDSYASVMRQIYFVIFERDIHEQLVEGSMTADEVAERYMETLREQFGDELDLADYFRWEWITIPHIYDRPFYCYAYTFGLLLVLALYQQYRSEGDAFVARYLKILEYGGSKAPMEILDEAGFNVRTKAFWQGGLDVIADMVNQLEALAK